MEIVADTNIFLAVSLEEPEKEEIIRLTSDTSIIAPKILPYKIGNALTSMFKRNRITQDEGLLTFETAIQIPVKLISVDIPQALKLAFDFNIYAYDAYDAYFLQCAQFLSCPLITLDKRMKQVATDLNIKVLE